MTAGHNALRGSGPNRKHAFKDALIHAGLPIPGSTLSAYVVTSSPLPESFCCDPARGTILTALANKFERKQDMPVSMRRALFLGIIACCSLNKTFAGQTGWRFGTEDRGHPELRYLENDKTVFYVGCGHAFGIHAVYPGPRKEDGAKVTITISSLNKQMQLKGEIESSHDDDPPNTTHFVQWDLGFKRQDPALYGTKWKGIEHRLFDLLDSRKPLTVSAEERNYVLPAVDAPDWRARFNEGCLGAAR
jgi:hypothetical protein